MDAMGNVETLLIAKCNDSDVGVTHQIDGTYLVQWNHEYRVVPTLSETVLLLDLIQGTGLRIPSRFMQDMAIQAISQMLEEANDNHQKE